MKSTAALLFISLLASCSSIRYLEIQTCNPAEITYQDNIRKVVIVGNALPQRPDTGCEYIVAGKKLPCEAHADSTINDACKALGHALIETDYFDDILLLDISPERDTTRLFSDDKISAEIVTAICEDTGADALISFDRLLFNSRREFIARPEGYIEGQISVRINAIVRSYIPEQAGEPTTVLFSDSISISDWDYDIDRLGSKLPDPSEALRLAAGYTGEKIYTTFVPHWINEQRWYYSGYTAKWKKATACAIAEKWSAAATAWLELYNSRVSERDKAKLASNLALYHELTGDLQQARLYAETASRIFSEISAEDDPFAFIQDQYKQTIAQRILDNEKLNLQIRTGR
jgi:hypothetical protein